MKKKIVEFVMQHIGVDGMLHLLFSFLISKFFSFFVFDWAAFLMAMTVGIGCEMYDKWSKKGTCEWRDILMDAIGATMGVI